MGKLVDKIEINCDMAEGFGRWKMGPDEELIKSGYIDTANVACGFHAGDPTLMLKVVRLAKQYGVKVGAHPGLEDKFGFGRRKIEVDPQDMYASILYQVGALKAFLDVENVPLHHIKPHGELYFYMQQDAKIMRAVLEAVKHYDVPVYACRNQLQTDTCAELAIPFQEEAYVDIDYDKDGKLVPVSLSKMATPQDIYNRMSSIGIEDYTINNEGNKLKLGFDGKPFSFCLHSDMPTVLENAKLGRKAVDEINAKKFSTAN